MSIQSNINQMSSVALLLATNNPTIRAAVDKREKMSKLAKQKEVLTRARDIMGESGRPEQAQGYQDEIAAVSKAAFETDPTKATAEKYLAERYYSTEGLKERAKPEEIAQEMYRKELREEEIQSLLNQYREAGRKAQEHLAVKQEEKRNTRRNFLDYIKNEPTSFGGSVGELDPKIQKQIKAAYSKSERQRIMNRKDAEDGR